MNALELFFQERCYTASEEIHALNLLTEHQIISDNVQTSADVADGDAVRAVKWLEMAGRITMDSGGRFARVEL